MVVVAMSTNIYTAKQDLLGTLWKKQYIISTERKCLYIQHMKRSKICIHSVKLEKIESQKFI